MFTCVRWCALVALIPWLAGCGGEAGTDTAVEPAAEIRDDAVHSSDASPGNPADDTVGAADETEAQLLLEPLTQAVRRYGMEQRRRPASLEELVTAGYLREVPRAPAGQRFAISRDLRVYLADE